MLWRIDLDRWVLETCLYYARWTCSPVAHAVEPEWLACRLFRVHRLPAGFGPPNGTPSSRWIVVLFRYDFASGRLSRRGYHDIGAVSLGRDSLFLYPRSTLTKRRYDLQFLPTTKHERHVRAHRVLQGQTRSRPSPRYGPQ